MGMNLSREWCREKAAAEGACDDVSAGVPASLEEQMSFLQERCGTLTAAATGALRQVQCVEKENVSLRMEVNALRAQLGMGRKYVEWNEDKTRGGCPVSGG